MITIRFQDNGQDFLEWDVVRGVVIDSRPFQYSIWAGTLILNQPIAGSPLRIRTKAGDTMTLKHRVQNVLIKEGAS